MRACARLLATAVALLAGCGAGHIDPAAGHDGGRLDGAAAADAGVLDDGGTPADAPVAPDAPADGPGADDAAVPADAPIQLDAGPSSERQTARPLGSTSAPNGFYEYLPPGYDDGVPRPLLVFWHGIGEDGNGTTDLSKVLANGPPRLIDRDQWPSDRPFIVLSPQHGPDNCPSAAEVQAFFTWALGAYRVDPKRVYLTGLSCGAIGSWSYLGAQRGAVVAAAVLVCGDPGDPTQSWSAWGKAGCGLGDLAVWAIHGDADTQVDIANERATMQNLLACASPPRREARWNAIPDAGHAIWGGVYDLSYGFDVYAFLLANPKP